MALDGGKLSIWACVCLCVCVKSLIFFCLTARSLQEICLAKLQTSLLVLLVIRLMSDTIGKSRFIIHLSNAWNNFSSSSYWQTYHSWELSPLLLNLLWHTLKRNKRGRGGKTGSHYRVDLYRLECTYRHCTRVYIISLMQMTELFCSGNSLTASFIWNRNESFHPPPKSH
jgi:hypothetical protein